MFFFTFHPFRYADPHPNLELFEIPCKHENGRFNCNNIPIEQLRLCRSKFFKHKSKIKQDNILSHLMTIELPKRRRSRRNANSHQFQVKCYLRIAGNKVNVCQNMFLKVFGVSQRRVQTIGKKMQSGVGITDKRGGDNRSVRNLEKKQKVKEFIASLKGRESHYGRCKSRRIYLSSEYNITILHKLYNDSVFENNKVNYKYFSRIFNNEFNIGFGSPATDVCGFCMRHRSQLSLCNDPAEKVHILTNLRVHNVRAKQFFN